MKLCSHAIAKEAVRALPFDLDAADYLDALERTIGPLWFDDDGVYFEDQTDPPRPPTGPGVVVKN